MKHPGGRPKGSPNKVRKEARERLQRFLAPREPAVLRRLFESKDDKIVLEVYRLCLQYCDGRPREQINVEHSFSVEKILEELAARRLGRTQQPLLPAAVETKEQEP